MRSFAACATLLAVLILAGFAVADGISVEENPAIVPGVMITPGTSGRAPWDLQFSFDVSGATGDLGNAGAEFDGTYFYTTRWASNLIHQFDIDGNLIKEFSIPGVSGLRDLAWDGEYMYGGAALGTIWQMDFENETLVGTITGSFQCRAIAYNEDDDVFIVSNWGDPVWVVDRSGAIVDQFDLVTATSNYGFAYDNMCGDGYLWVFDQGSGAGTAQYIHQWDLGAGVFTGVQYDVTQDFPGTEAIAGGLWLSSDFVPGTVTIGGLLQTESTDTIPNTMFAYELCDNPIQTSIIPLNGTIFDPGDIVQYRVTVSNTATWPIPITAEVYADLPTDLTLVGPVDATLPGGFSVDRDLENQIPPSAPPITVPICIDAEGSVACYSITIQ